MRQVDCLVVGGGLAGIFASLRLADAGARVTLVDQPLPEATGLLGGFAKFSGAKFSLPPAGLGLLPVAGTADRLLAVYREVLVRLHLPAKGPIVLAASLISTEDMGNENRGLRSYQSIVLTPSEMDNVLARLTNLLRNYIEMLRGTCIECMRDGANWVVRLAYEDGGNCEFSSPAIFFAGGRRQGDLLSRVGASESTGKGVDLGFRVEFPTKGALEPLRRLGPDAKILHGSCRTFCLNVPGEVFRYDFEGLPIPGGIVADESTVASNVGVLCRCPEKGKTLKQVIANAHNIGADELKTPLPAAASALDGAWPLMSALYGSEISQRLEDFCQVLELDYFIDWSKPHRIHLPLLDWHWKTYGRPRTFQTSCPGLYALGDLSGHARGLLQAAVSGWLAAEELLT